MAGLAASTRGPTGLLSLVGDKFFMNCFKIPLCAWSRLSIALEASGLGWDLSIQLFGKHLSWQRHDRPLL
jgi:hypothetical protein